MFLLDTNVVSELRKARAGKADVHVAAWAARVPAASLFLSVIVVYELELGVLLAQRRDQTRGSVLRTWLTEQVLPFFAGRILPVDVDVASRAAALDVPDRRPVRDGLIAATALVHSLTVVTRNVGDFLPTSVGLLDPWKDPDANP